MAQSTYEIFASGFNVHNYGIALGGNQFQLQYGALELVMPAPVYSEGEYTVIMRVGAVSGFSGSGNRHAGFSLSTSVGNASRGIGSVVNFTDNGQIVTIVGKYEIPFDPIYIEYTNLTIKCFCLTNGDPIVVRVYDGIVIVSGFEGPICPINLVI